MKHIELSRVAPLGVALLAGLLVGGFSSSALAQTPKLDPGNPGLQKPRLPEPIVRPYEVTNEILVRLKPGADVRRFARDYNVLLVQPLREAGFTFVFSTNSVARASALEATLPFDLRVEFVGNNAIVRHTKFAFTPNDPYFHKNTPSTGYHGQWHLINEYGTGIDANVKPAWDADITGQGVVIGIVDDCLEKNHPDLAPNYDAADSWDFGQNDSDPSPVNTSDMHGVSTSGVAAARGGNGIGVTGAAPYASLAGLRCDFNSGTSSMFYNAVVYHSTGSNRSIKIKNHSYGYADTYVNDTTEASGITQSSAAGTVHCYAAGNERGSVAEDSNKSIYGSHPGAICVAALGQDGKFSYYSNFGACVFVTAPSSSSTWGITTTDRTGTGGYNGFPDNNYTDDFGGTSSSTPLVAGVMALVKQVQPNLDVRFAKHLLARTCDVVDASDTTATSDGGWKTNGAGLKFNQNYGFGKVNAGKLVAEAVKYTGVSTLQSHSTGTVSVNQAIPDNNQTGVTRTFQVSATTPVEAVTVNLIAAHPYRGDLEAYLTSPSGTTIRLMRVYSGDSGNLSWTFEAVGFWGENPQGTWTLTMKDVDAGGTGTWTSYAATITMGQLVSATPQLQSLTVTPSSVVGGTSATGTVTLSSAPSSDTAVSLSSDKAAATVPASVTVLAGHTTADFTITTSAVATNQTATITATYNATSKTATLTVNAPSASALSLNPTSVIGGTGSTGTVTINGPAPSGGIAVTLASSNTAAAQVSSPVTVPAGQTSVDFPITTSAVAADVTATISATLGVTKTATLTVKAASLTALDVQPASVPGGLTATGTVSLDGPAPAGGTTVSLSSSAAQAQVPASVTVAAGQTTGTFTITTTAVAADVSATISATLGSVTKTAPLTVKAPVPIQIDLNPTEVVGGLRVSAKVTLSGPAPAGGQAVTLRYSSPLTVGPYSVTVAEGQTTASFTIKTAKTRRDETSIITARANGVSVTAPLLVKMTVIYYATLKSVSVSPTSVTGGTSVRVTVELEAPAPSGFMTVIALSDDSGYATTPANLMVPAGRTTASTTITTTAVPSDQLVTVTASYRGVVKTAQFTITQ